MRSSSHFLLASAAVAAIAGATAPAPGYPIVKLPAGSAEVRAAGRLTRLGPGSPGWTLPRDTIVEIVSGGIWAQFGAATVKAAPGDSLRVRAEQGLIRLEAVSGRPLVVRPDGSSRPLEAGQTFALLAPEPPSPKPVAAGGCSAAPARASSKDAAQLPGEAIP